MKNKILEIHKNIIFENCGQKTSEKIFINISKLFPEYLDIKGELAYFYRKNPIFAIEQSWMISSKIWHIIRDDSIDHNFYTKRMILAGIYMDGVCRIEYDRSENLSDTISFLREKIYNRRGYKGILKKIPILRLL